MGEDDDLKINSLHRFAKHSPRLTLREYSHCEVPAGCGGVVMRWVDPHDGTPVLVRVIVIGAADTWLDGAPMRSSYARIEPGRHVVAAHLTKLGESWGDPIKPPVPLSLSVTFDAGPDAARGDNLLMLASDVRWSAATSRPPEGFGDPAFDDAAWPELPLATDEVRRKVDADHLGRLDEADVRARAVGSRRVTETWIRVSFTLGEATLRAARERA
jgi:hypothetical protein